MPQAWAASGQSEPDTADDISCPPYSWQTTDNILNEEKLVWKCIKGWFKQSQWHQWLMNTPTYEMQKKSSFAHTKN